ncbi:MAG TPA: long-chain-fatty-acid--CoA ligase [Geminicoccaceae bacterium]
MQGLMMDRPLLISSIIEYAARHHRSARVVSWLPEGGSRRSTYQEIRDRALRLASALQGELRISPGDRVATLAWNDARHLELYYAISGMGAVCHTINPRLSDDQICYIVNHARDRVLFADPGFLPLIDRLRARLQPLAEIVLMTGRDGMPAGRSGFRAYEEVLEAGDAGYVWPEFDERTASGLCYTSGTTGTPKGTLYSHRSTVLHSLATALPSGLHLAPSDVVLPVVPMFHVNAWGLPYTCPLIGTGLVMPGPRLDGPSLFQQLEAEGVTFSAGVPTVWRGLLAYLRESGERPSTLARVVIGGSSAPPAMIRAFEEEFGIEVIHGWGMTEMSPVGTIGGLPPHLAARPAEERFRIKEKQGRPIYGCEIKIVNERGERVAEDGRTSGVLMVRGPWVTSGYYEDAAAGQGAFDADGWFSTGDVATIDADGFMHITDRAKDMIKSGGEWISSIDLENAAMAHPDVAEAAVVGVPHPKWDERPLLVVVPRAGAAIDRDALLGFLAGKVAKLWLPDDVVMVDQLPLTATGKVRKATLRERYKDYRLPTA